MCRAAVQEAVSPPPCPLAAPADSTCCAVVQAAVRCPPCPLAAPADSTCRAVVQYVSCEMPSMPASRSR
ncbi:hypothetical protein B0H12DRAFT_819717 [Mycena haematopus]|nr:hypothetical protein B0H12DRAFT_819717 [Mycena haematopus]